jgi:predicted DCC family thiol-disulfide oxidoreductase YuxK
MPQPVSGACVLLYDGVCGLCRHTIRWMLRHDPQGRLRYAPLRQALAGEVFARHALDPQQIDSVVLVLHFGEPEERVAVRSDAILGCLSVLGGGWALLAAVARLVPRALRDIAYNWLARNRHRLFGNGESCTLPTSAERARFLDI